MSILCLFDKQTFVNTCLQNKYMPFFFKFSPFIVIISFNRLITRVSCLSVHHRCLLQICGRILDFLMTSIDTSEKKILKFGLHFFQLCFQ